MAKLVVVVLTCVAIAACGAPAPEVASDPPTGRALILPIVNNQTPATFTVRAWDGSHPGDVIGAAQPSTLAPMATGDVVFRVPDGGGWAIFSNKWHPGEPVLEAADVPAGFTGRIPFTLVFDGEGMRTTDGPIPPGWFGQ